MERINKQRAYISRLRGITNVDIEIRSNTRRTSGAMVAPKLESDDSDDDFDMSCDLCGESEITGILDTHNRKPKFFDSMVNLLMKR